MGPNQADSPRLLRDVSLYPTNTSRGKPGKVMVSNMHDRSCWLPGAHGLKSLGRLVWKLFLLSRRARRLSAEWRELDAWGDPEDLGMDGNWRVTGRGRHW